VLALFLHLVQQSIPAEIQRLSLHGHELEDRTRPFTSGVAGLAVLPAGSPSFRRAAFINSPFLLFLRYFCV
jgi:hypothetical protein